MNTYNPQPNPCNYNQTCPQPAQNYTGPTVPAEFALGYNHLAMQALASEQSRSAAQNEVFRLEQQLARMQAAEEAFTKVIERDDRLLVFDRSGSSIELLNCTVERAVHFLPAPPFSSGELYQICLAGVSVELNLSIDNYMNDRRLLDALAELPGVRVSILRRSVGLTANNLRLAFARKMRAIQPDFWGGWQRTQSGEFCFRRSVLDGKTHASNSIFTEYVALDGFPSSAETVASVQNLWNVGLAPITNPEIRWTALLALHTSCLYALLRQLSYPFIGAFCIFSDDAAALAFFRNLFQWNGDPAISLDDSSVAFDQGVLERKDEPLLIRDSWSSANAKGNSMRLVETLQTLRVSWKKKQDSQLFPLQGLPVILSDAASALVCAPQVLTIELDSGDFNVRLWTDAADSVQRMVAEYVNVFLRFAQSNVSAFQELLKAKEREAMRGGYGLSPRCTQIFGVLLAVDAFIKTYFQMFRLPLPADVNDEEVRKRFLLGLLRDADEREDCCANLVGQFVEVVRLDFANRRLRAQAKSSAETPEDNTVFFDEAYLYFTSEAFCSVCGRLSCSRPTLIHALDSAGFLRGTPTNQSTAKTRIRVPGADGSRRSVSVYMFPREIFDRFGDPLMFEEENT